MACGAGKVEPAKYLLGHGVDPNVICRSGDTPLHVASQNGHAAAVSFVLLGEGSQIRIGFTPKRGGGGTGD